MRLLAAVIVLFASSGCSLMGSKDPPKADFDFGPLPAASGARYTSNYPGVSIVVYEVAAPAWIDSSSMYYRLAYQNAASPCRTHKRMGNAARGAVDPAPRHSLGASTSARCEESPRKSRPSIRALGALSVRAGLRPSRSQPRRAPGAGYPGRRGHVGAADFCD